VSCPKHLEQALGYSFRDPKLCAKALLHSSAGGAAFQRLEYLGDAVLSLAVALRLYERHPDWDEGQLTKVRAALVQKSYLTDLAERIGLNCHLRVSGHLGTLPAREGGQGVLADAFEALLGAVQLDSGLDEVLRIVDRLFDEAGIDRAGHPKSELQEWMQARGQPLPAYREVSRSGADHALFFEVECEFPSSGMRFSGSGRSLKEAESEAAERALHHVRSASGA